MEALDRNGISEKLDSISTTDRNYTDNDALLSEEDSELSSKAFKSRSRSFLITCGACGAHVVMVLIYLSWTMALLKHKSWLMECKPGPDLIYSPAREAVKYETVLMNNSLFDKNIFKGRPRPEQTAAWNTYRDLQGIAVSAEELKAINRSSIPLPDGSGYLAMLDVFHEVHCLNIIREYIHRDYYISKETPQRRFEHADHCIDALRQILICHGDISLVTFDWVEHDLHPFPNFNVNRECRNWDNILEWTKARKANTKTLVNPYLEGRLPPRDMAL